MVKETKKKMVSKSEQKTENSVYEHPGTFEEWGVSAVQCFSEADYLKRLRKLRYVSHTLSSAYSVREKCTIFTKFSFIIYILL